MRGINRIRELPRYPCDERVTIASIICAASIFIKTLSLMFSLLLVASLPPSFSHMHITASLCHYPTICTSIVQSIMLIFLLIYTIAFLSLALSLSLSLVYMRHILRIHHVYVFNDVISARITTFWKRDAVFRRVYMPVLLLLPISFDILPQWRQQMIIF